MLRSVIVARLGLFACSAFAATNSPQMMISPVSGGMDAPFHVVVESVLPGSQVRVTASRPDSNGHLWVAVGTYLADTDGRVDVDYAPSLIGTYQGISPHGLWCSAAPVPPEDLDKYIEDLPKHPGLGTAPDLDESAIYSIQLSATIEGRQVASATATRSYGATVVQEAVRTADGVRGVFFLPVGRAAKVPVVVLTGSGGGLPLKQAALLASNGHPALAQGIFDYQDLPSSLLNIPIETIQAGARWLEQRTHTKRVAVMGTSRGSEAAGLAASYFPKDFSATVLYVPSHLSNGALGPGVTGLQPAWTIAGHSVPADRAESDTNDMGDNAVEAKTAPGFVGTPHYLKTWNDPAISAAYGIPFERLEGPVLAIGAGADEMWPSSIGAEQIRRRLAQNGKAHLIELVNYPSAGHLIVRVGSGGPLSTFVLFPSVNAFWVTGGLPNSNCEDSYDAWKKVLVFLAKMPAKMDE